MTTPLPSINDPMPDLGHEGIRVAVLAAITDVTANIVQLRADFAAAQTNLTTALTQIADLTARVTALETLPPAPTP